MKRIAIAIPHAGYRWSNTLKGTSLEAFLCNNEVLFFTKENDISKPITEEACKNMFRVDLPLVDQPYLVTENMDFWIILHRKFSRYKNQYVEIKRRHV